LPDEQALMRSALRSPDNRTDSLVYARVLAFEQFVGFGLIESAHRHVLQD
jgi:hypothetical protein